jgi:AcrR family transcriptional regulator
MSFDCATLYLNARACAAKGKSVSSATAKITDQKRAYRLGTRARKQRETRLRIVEAAVDLHCTIGPARTTVSQIADRAGVQRHTYYAHFPDERSLFLACSALAMEREPLPDLERLRAIPPGRARLCRGLELFYGWFKRNAQHAGCVLRDSEHHALTREMVELRIAPGFHKAAQIMGEGLDGRARTLLDVALDFYCWRNLARTSSPKRAAALMSDAIIGVGADE